MADQPATHSITLADTHEPKQREVQFHFMSNAIAIVCGNVGSQHAIGVGTSTIDRDGARSLVNELSRWLDGKPAMIGTESLDAAPYGVDLHTMRGKVFSCERCRHQITGYPCVRCGHTEES